MMTACDLNGTTKPWEIQKEVRSVFFSFKKLPLFQSSQRLNRVYSIALHR